jgi:Ca-activated chloride channel family protein
MADEVQLTVSTNKDLFPVLEEPQVVYVLIEALTVGHAAGVRMPLNFGLVLDHSGSMEGKKIESLRHAAALAISQMTPQDRVSVTIFDDRVETVVPSQTVVDLEGMKRQIQSIQADAGTKIALGLRNGLDELSKGLGSAVASRMLLLTDGQTFGDEEECRHLAEQAAGLGVPIVALGLGDDWNERLLDDIAGLSGGTADFIPAEHPENILKAFEQQVRGAQAAVIQNATMVLRLVPGVTPRAVWRVTPMITKLGQQALSDRAVQVPLGDLGNDQVQGFLIELLVAPRQAGTYRLAQAEIAYDVAALGLYGEKVKCDLLLNFLADSMQTAQNDLHVLNIVEKVTTHKLQTQAMEEAAVGNLPGATQKLRAAATRLLNLGEEKLAQTALEEAQRLEEGQELSSQGTKKLRYETRKLTQKLDE